MRRRIFIAVVILLAAYIAGVLTSEGFSLTRIGIGLATLTVLLALVLIVAAARTEYNGMRLG